MEKIPHYVRHTKARDFAGPDHKCPSCGSRKLKLKKNKSGEFLVCQSCRATMPIVNVR
jgi:ssDNA-binding Zn-finger/Zn-ribbon topoisomerase 1